MADQVDLSPLEYVSVTEISPLSKGGDILVQIHCVDMRAYILERDSTDLPKEKRDALYALPLNPYNVLETLEALKIPIILTEDDVYLGDGSATKEHSQHMAERRENDGPPVFSVLRKELEKHPAVMDVLGLRQVGGPDEMLPGSNDGGPGPGTGK